MPVASKDNQVETEQTTAEQIHELELQIRVNEGLPSAMQCPEAIAEMKDKLARLRAKSNKERVQITDVRLQQITSLANLIKLLEQVEQSAYLALPLDEAEDLQYRLFMYPQIAGVRLTNCLAKTGLLIGAEHCDECAEVKGTVTRIDRDPDLMTITSAGPVDVRDVIFCGHYFRLPGSGAYGEDALVELARARVDQHAPDVPAAGS